MTRSLTVTIALIALLIFIAGCPEVSPEPPELPKAESIEPPKIEPQKPEPAKEKPPQIEPPKPTPQPTVTFHDKCAYILTNFVNDNGMVDYKNLKRKKPQLNKLFDEFEKLDPKQYNSWPKQDKIAFWINAYNIHLLKIIIDNYPIQSSRLLRVLPGWGPNSIRHIDKNIGGIHKQKFIVMDEEFTLTEIEQRFLRKEFDEPRALLSVHRASLSGPPLRNEPYYGQKLYQQLDKQAKKLLSSQRAFRIDREKKIVHLSALLEPEWFGKDFIRKYGTNKKFKDQKPAVSAVLNFASKYISKQDVSFLETENYSVKFINYDWRLNE
ncbi:MAG: DUF547 domain-containing protein [Planctomycetota bacterium]|jgi:hypothetical protein